MHPRPDWFNLFKYAVLKLIVCIGVITFTYSGYLIPILLGRIRVDLPYIPMIGVVLLSVICLASFVAFFGWLFILAVQYILVNKEDKICCFISMLSNTMFAFFTIMVAVYSGPIGTGPFWDIVGQCYLWLLALLYGLLPIAMLLYSLALVWLDHEAQSSGGIVDGQPMAVVVIPGKSTPGTRAAPGTAATPGSTAASSAT